MFNDFYCHESCRPCSKFWESGTVDQGIFDGGDCISGNLIENFLLFSIFIKIAKMGSPPSPTKRKKNTSGSGTTQNYICSVHEV
jgi:hypothetical protein